ncbi:MAG: PAS domain-containing protein, partial [Deltaproteobacteria bacterium]|nr:PAS domain-containing protein [Deltaproteobacteria bacterium]
MKNSFRLSVVYQFRVGCDGSWSFPYLSDGVRELAEFSPEAVYADPSVITDCIFEEDRELVRRSVEQATKELIPWALEFRIRTPSGAVKWVRGQSQPAHQEDGSVLRNGIFLDISKTKATEAHLHRLQNLYTAVIEANLLVSSSRNANELFGEICRIAWIGVPNAATQYLDPVVRFGEGVDILDEEVFYARIDGAESRGQAGTAFSENRTVLNQDFLRNSSTKRWHDLGRNYGFGSSASFPIRENDQ